MRKRGLVGFSHYVRVDGRGRVVKGYSDAYVVPGKGDIRIAENAPPEFEICSLVGPSLFDFHGVPMFAYEGGACRLRTDAEREGDTPAAGQRYEIWPGYRLCDLREGEN